MATTYGGEIVIKVSNNVLHQLSSRVFGTLAKEILNYDVIYEDTHLTKNFTQLTEREKLFETLEELMYVNLLLFLTSPFQIYLPNMTPDYLAIFNLIYRIV